MAEVMDGYPKFANDDGVTQVLIGVREFECIGARPPHDHPHVYLDMGDRDYTYCPYCSTLYKFDERLGRLECDPPECFYEEAGLGKGPKRPVGRD
jgi:uncharacterized Zn-finger protein